MSTMTRRQALAAVAMLGGAGAALAMTPVKGPADAAAEFSLGDIVPARFGSWHLDDTVVPVLPDPEARALLDELYNQTISRTYANGAGSRVMLVVAYGGDQSDGLNIHRPEVCYGSQGFQVHGMHAGEVALRGGLRLPVRRLHAVKGVRQEPVTYWMRVGDEVVLGAFERKLAQLAFGFRRQVPDGVLVRVSSLGERPPEAFALHDKFIGELLASMTPAGREFLLGPTEDSLG